MPVETNLANLSQTAASNSPPGSESPTTIDDYHRQALAFIAMLRDSVGFTNPVQLASAATTSIGAQNSMFVEITGTTGITSFGATYKGPRLLRFTGALTLTHSDTLSLPGAANITTAAGDTAIAVPNFALNGWNVYHYQRAATAPGGVYGTVAIANGGTGQTTASAAFDALKQAATTTATGVVELATDDEAKAGTDTDRALTPSRLKQAQIILQTAVASTSGTNIDFTGIPSFVRRITVMLRGVSTNAASTFLVRIGDAGGIESAAYASAAVGVSDGGGAVHTGATSGYSVGTTGAAGDVLHAQLILSKITGNYWTITGSSYRSGATSVGYSISGMKELSDTLTHVRVTTSGGDTFDNGDINVSWE